MNQSQYTYILYKASSCKTCGEFLNQLQKLPAVYKTVMIIDVQDPRVRGKLPSAVKSVPTLMYVRKSNSGSENIFLEDDEAFQWLHQKIQENQNRGLEAMNNNGGVADWSYDMNSGFSDNYSFLQGDVPIAKNFGFLDNNSKDGYVEGFIPKILGKDEKPRSIQGRNAGFAATQNVSSSSGNGKKDEMEKRMQQLQEQRAREVPQSIQQKRMSMGGAGGGDNFSHMNYS
jgi:hypothetical protein